MPREPVIRIPKLGVAENHIRCEQIPSLVLSDSISHRDERTMMNTNHPGWCVVCDLVLLHRCIF